LFANNLDSYKSNNLLSLYAYLKTIIRLGGVPGHGRLKHKEALSQEGRGFGFVASSGPPTGRVGETD
jgi:hypothetical protein